MKETAQRIVNTSAQYLRAHPRISAGVTVGIVLLVMAYGAYVSVFLPRQRMKDISEAYSLSQYGRVIEIAQKVIDSDPRNVSATLALVAAMLQQAQLDGTMKEVLPKARELLLIAERFDPENSEVQRQLGYVAMLGGDYDLARGYVTKAVEFDPSSSMAYAYACMFYTNINNVDAAKKTCDEAYKLDPYEPLILILNARVNIDTNNLRQARINAESAILYAKDPVTLAEAYSISAFVSIASYDIPRARQQVEMALSHNPKDADSLNLLGEIAMRTIDTDILAGKKPETSKDWIPMLESASASMRANPKNYYPYLLFMRAYEMVGDTVRANQHREIARGMIMDDPTLTEIDREVLYARLDAAENITVNSIRLLEKGETLPEGTPRAYIIQTQ